MRSISTKWACTIIIVHNENWSYLRHKQSFVKELLDRIDQNNDIIMKILEMCFGLVSGMRLPGSYKNRRKKVSKLSFQN